MPDYERSMTMEVPPEEVLDFVSDVRNLPAYVPTTKEAEPQGEDRVRIAGEIEGERVEADGYLRREGDRLEWGADEGYYKGWLEVEAAGDDGSEVTVGISLDDAHAEAAEDGQIEEALQKGLESIRDQLTGRGGKKEPSFAG